MPYLAEMSTRLRARHPQARIWLSLQHFDTREIDFLFGWIDRERPAWLGGLVAGPGSYSLAQMRARLDRRYQVRDYPDVTHTVRSQYPVPWWDPALNLTFGREPINPRAVFYAAVHDRLAPSTDGFITYSDGVNDDLNKVVWTRKAWDPDTKARDIVLDYSRFFFGAAVAERAADGLLALERNWEGPLASNGGVTATLTLWQQLETRRARARAELAVADVPAARLLRCLHARAPALRDGASRPRPTPRSPTAPRAGRPRRWTAPAPSWRAPAPGCCPAWRQRIEALVRRPVRRRSACRPACRSYQASGYERGAVLDFVDHPLNNRWWLEDEFAKVRALARRAGAAGSGSRLLRTWARPGRAASTTTSATSPRRRTCGRGRARDAAAEPEVEPTPHFAWEGRPTRAPSVLAVSSMRWPRALVYENLDPSAGYLVRLNVMTNTAAGQVAVRIDDQAGGASHSCHRHRGPAGAIAVPAAAVADGRLVHHLRSRSTRAQVNWRLYSRLVEAWLIKQDPPPRPRETAGAR